MAGALDVSEKVDAAVAIVGAGLAGTLAASVLGRKGIQVLLVDARPAVPPVFKAEKIEPDQIALLRKLGVSERDLSHAKRIREIRSYFGSHLFRVTPTEEYGISYRELVMDVRAALPAAVRFVQARAAAIANGPDVQRLRLADGRELTARLAILACGLNGEIPQSLGIQRQWVNKPQSVALAFTIAPANGRPFAFDSATCYPTSTAMGIDYVTFFRMGDGMRANLFAFPTGDDAWVREFVREPVASMRKCFPGLERAIGGYRVMGGVETSLVNLYKTNHKSMDGVALIGDASQNACPSTGSGVTKVLTDVGLLCGECVPRWLATDGMGSGKLAEFYGDARKRAVDEQSMADAMYRRRARTDESLRWKIHRARIALGMRFGKPDESAMAKM
jgi:2-polyprenyl-6-methoxyphenol hydroxylase-like FAD-dependent oxidoreductase